MPIAANNHKLSAAKRSLLAVIESLRLYQWIKNALIFIPLILGGKIQSGEAWSATFTGFIALGILASATYIVNDLCDRPYDRHHWSKKNRPIARGDLSVRGALTVASICLAISLAIAMTVDRNAVLMLILYCAVSLAYSLWFKQVPLLDVVILASLYTFRLIFGIQLAGVTASPWLLVFSMFIFTSLSLAKRGTETRRNGDRGNGQVAGRGYVADDCAFLFALGTSTAVGAVLIMVLYLFHEAFDVKFYSSPKLLWPLPVILTLWIGRIWLLVGRVKLDDDPFLFSLRDRISLCLGVGMALTFLSAWQL